MGNSKVVYTCLTGRYDALQDPLIKRNDWDYICFTDRTKEIKSAIWDIRPIPFNHNNKTVLSRYPKLNPHLVLDDYQYSMYHDSNIQIAGDYLYEKAEELIKNNSLISIPEHPLRNCVYQEAKVIKREGIESAKKIGQIISELQRNKFPHNMGLYENAIIFRKHMDLNIIKLSNTWWELFLKYVKRDQLTLTYLLWKNNIQCSNLLPSDTNMRNFSAISYQRHNRKIKKSLKRRYLKYKNRFSK
ncbi:MAG: glycosyltransferase domain-containing protein [Bacteroidota bacterium]